MGKQSLHNLEINFGDYHYTREIGLRQVESEYDSIKKIRVYKINKKKILLLGAGWSPDLFLRQKPNHAHLSLVHRR